jgi:hypothetical protein
MNFALCTVYFFSFQGTSERSSKFSSYQCDEENPMTRAVLTAAFASAVTILGISFAQAHSQGTGTAQNDGPSLMQLAQAGGGGAGGSGSSGSSGSSSPQGPATMPQGGTTGTTPQEKSDAKTKQVRPGETPTNNPPSK